jgi:hypothetical protein
VSMYPYIITWECQDIGNEEGRILALDSDWGPKTSKRN